MKTRVTCGHCQAKMMVKAELAGKQIRCPRCQNTVRVTLTPVIVGQAALTPKPEPMQAILLPSEPATPFAEALVEPEPLVEPDPPTQDEALQASLREQKREKLRKKKIKKKIQESTKIPKWAWIAGGLGGLFVLGGLAFMFYLMMTVTDDAVKVVVPGASAVKFSIPWWVYVLELAIGIPTSLVILVISMFASSALGGGINFGDAKTAILGAFFLVTVANLVNLIPYVGFWLTLPIFLVGFMTIFGLDIWEARFLYIINFILSYIVFQLLLPALIEQLIVGSDSDSEDEEELLEKPRRRGNSRKDRDKEPDKRDIPDPDDDEWGPGDLGVLHDRLHHWLEKQEQLKQYA